MPELYVFVADSHLPNRDAWQRAIEHLGFPAVLDPTLDLRVDSGYSPTAYRGRDTGFEVYVAPAAEILSAHPQIASKVGNRDTCVTFRWGGDLTECAVALSAAGGLVTVADGIYFYPDEDVVYDAQAALAIIHKELTLI